MQGSNLRAHAAGALPQVAECVRLDEEVQMRRLFLQINVSLDGFIEDAERDRLALRRRRVRGVHQ
jgi:hypothetical protein